MLDGAALFGLVLRQVGPDPQPRVDVLERFSGRKFDLEN